MIFDNTCRLENDPLRDDRLALRDCPPYTPAAGDRRHG
jgi:hypothetical protein